MHPGPTNSLTDVPGLRVGHAVLAATSVRNDVVDLHSYRGAFQSAFGGGG